MKQNMMGQQWHQLDHMHIICTSLQTDNHVSSTSNIDQQLEVFNASRGMLLLYFYSTFTTQFFLKISLRNWTEKHQIITKK